MVKVVDVSPEDLERLRKEMGDKAKWLEQYPPDRLYYHLPTGKRGVIVSYQEDGTCHLFYSGRWNLLLYERIEKDVPLNELVECELPDPSEPTGVVIDDVHEFETAMTVHGKEALKSLLEESSVNTRTHH